MRNKVNETPIKELVFDLIKKNNSFDMEEYTKESKKFNDNLLSLQQVIQNEIDLFKNELNKMMNWVEKLERDATKTFGSVAREEEEMFNNVEYYNKKYETVFSALANTLEVILDKEDYLELKNKKVTNYKHQNNGKIKVESVKNADGFKQNFKKLTKNGKADKYLFTEPQTKITGKKGNKK